MDLDTKQLEENHLFTFTKHLVFESKSFKQNVINHSIPNKNELELGKRYQKELKEGYVPQCFVKKVSHEVGYGLFSLQKFKKGDFIGEYTGRICSDANYYRMNDYLFRYPVKEASGKELSIDAEPFGNHTRFINHSFTPNLDHRFAFHNHLFHLILIANCSIEINEQFSFSYGHGYWYLRGAPESL